MMWGTILIAGETAKGMGTATKCRNVYINLLSFSQKFGWSIEMKKRPMI